MRRLLSITEDTLLNQADELIISVTKVLEGVEEEEIVRLLLRLRSLLAKDVSSRELSPQAEAARAEVINVVNNFFFEKLTAIPEIKSYLENVQNS